MNNKSNLALMVLIALFSFWAGVGTSWNIFSPPKSPVSSLLPAPCVADSPLGCPGYVATQPVPPVISGTTTTAVLQKEECRDYMGTLTAEGNKKIIYTNKKLGFQFRYPANWRLKDNLLGCQEHGALTLLTYPESAERPRSLTGQDGKSNIDVYIRSEDVYIASTEGFVDNKITKKLVTIAGGSATRYDVEGIFGAMMYHDVVYFVPDQNNTNRYIGFRIFGDPVNLIQFDEMVQTIKWLPL